ncbi:DUF4391 domain-containing protein [Flavobacterium alkalisoli]|uniref:DUF4391 domain-containing protein n=1 Tax=Flavobacterium alkalisoli TaxID=2602769 RepID=A0A5B9G089_9FLAO|nr:DUF4391 domain-containing protein [Flavobacterium alkalisoli]QEE50702.1 DUF4391 domain-containing protein [Flavobacterium alkalisoli]
MSFNYNNIFGLPERTLLNKKITKSFFLKNFELTAAEKKLLNDIPNINWFASIKQSSVNVSPVKTSAYSYEEIQIIIITLSDNITENLANKYIQFVQKYIPYHSIVIAEDDNYFMINVSEKRINLADTNKRIIERDLSTQLLSKLYKNESINTFFQVINFSALNKNNLETLYKSYIGAIVQLKTATVTGKFNLRGSNRTAEDLLTLEKIENLEKEIITLSNQIKKETQLNQKVSLNIEIQDKRNQIHTLKTTLSNGH